LDNEDDVDSIATEMIDKMDSDKFQQYQTNSSRRQSNAIDFFEFGNIEQLNQNDSISNNNQGNDLDFFNFGQVNLGNNNMKKSDNLHEKVEIKKEVKNDLFDIFNMNYNSVKKDKKQDNEVNDLKVNSIQK